MQSTIQSLLSFINHAPTAWHAVDEAKKILESNGFTALNENLPWKLAPEGRYYVTRNGSALCAFVLPEKKPQSMKIVAAHTDSPALKIKPRGEHRNENMVMFSLEIYGSPLLSSWLNRDLGIAGRITFLDSKGSIKNSNVNIQDAPLVIPQLAIHLDREVNEKGLLLNKQQHLVALAALNFPEEKHYLESLLKNKLPIKQLLGSDLFLYPLEDAKLIGANKELISSYRFDNLGSVHAALTGLIADSSPTKETVKMIALWDNEEIGSKTPQGAESPFLKHTAERIVINSGGNREEFLIFLNKSTCLSVDQVHALHPNYPERHDPQHQPLLGKGVVVKHNAGHRYATESNTEAHVRYLCLQEKLPLQTFVSRGDIPSGSTIGPIHATVTGIKTVDVGCPQLSMHSARELGASQDHLDMCKLTESFLNTHVIMD